jgi:hypothetical protein
VEFCEVHEMADEEPSVMQAGVAFMLAHGLPPFPPVDVIVSVACAELLPFELLQASL